MVYDLIIIGAGPAGLTAGIYASQYNLRVLILGRKMGGYVTKAPTIHNFPSQPHIRGDKLAEKIINQARDSGARIKKATVTKVKQGRFFNVQTKENSYKAKKLILAIGRNENQLDLEANKFFGRGVSYCGTCDAPLYKGGRVGIYGSGNGVLEEALLLKEYAEEVYLFYPGKSFSEKKSLVEQVKKANIEIMFNQEVKRLKGNENLKSVVLDQGKEIELDGLFIGRFHIPPRALVQDLGLKMEGGYIPVEKNQKTNVYGVFVAGDITTKPLKQVLTSAAEGAIAAFSVYREIRKEES